MIGEIKKEGSYLDQLFHLMTHSKQLNISWVARIHQTNGGYRVTMFYCDGKRLKDIESINAPSLFILTELLIGQLSQGKNEQVIPFIYENETFLVSVSDRDVTSVIPFVQFALHLLQQTKKREGDKQDIVNLATKHDPKAGQMPLSSREIDVLNLLAEGASTTEAADILHLSEYTVRDYVSDIMRRLGAKNRTEAVVKAIRQGWIQLK